MQIAQIVQSWARGSQQRRPHDPQRLTILAILAVASSPPALFAAEDSPLVEMVLDAMDANYAAVASASMTFSEDRRDASVDRERVTRSETPSGGVVEVTRRPATQARLKVWLEADKLRVDRFDGAVGENRLATFVVRANQCTQLVDGHQAAWIRRLGEMPGMLPLDPRQYGSGDIRRDFHRIFSEEEIVEAAVNRDDRGEAFVRIVSRSSAGAETTYEFSESAGYLPTRLLTHWPDGSVLQVIDVRYATVGEGTARMPTSLTQRFFDEGVAKKPDSQHWRQQLKREAVGQIVVNQKIPTDVFDLQMPAGVRVSDNLRNAVYRVALPLPQRSGNSLLWATAAITFVLLLAVLAKHILTLRSRAY